MDVTMFQHPQSGEKEAKSEKESNPRLSEPRKSTFDDDDHCITFSDDDISVWITTPLIESKANFIKRQLYIYAVKDEWDKAKLIYDEFPDMIRAPLAANGDTVFHVAVSANRTSFVKNLVEHMTRISEILEISNSDGNTAFCLAAISGIDEIIETMTQVNRNLPLIPGQDKMLPIQLAALNGHLQIVEKLLGKFPNCNLLGKMAQKDIEGLFFTTIDCGMYDVATKLFDKYRDMLATARDDQQRTALHMLARKPPRKISWKQSAATKILKGQEAELDPETQLLQDLWRRIRELEHQKISELINNPCPVLFDAVKSENVNVVKQLLYLNPELLRQKDSTGRNLLHFAVLHQRRNIFYYICNMSTAEHVSRTLDDRRNNVLHLAATQPEEGPSSLYAKTRRHMWFKEVEKKVPRELRNMRNSNGKTPYDIFYANRKELSNEVKDTASGIANSGMVVATLIATVAFAAALTVPGDKNNAWFIVFILTNALALFTSSASIVSFLTIFTSSWFRENQFVTSILPGLINLGLALLFISIVTLFIAFAAASFLIFGHISKWVAFVVLSLSLLPIILFGALQFSLFVGLLEYCYWSIHYHVSK